MIFENNFSLSFDKIDDLNTYFSLLEDNDFDFKTKDIKMEINKKGLKIDTCILAKTFIELKIANSSFMSCVEIINKTLKI